MSEEKKLTDVRYMNTEDWYTDFFECSECGSRNVPLGAKFCSNCGTEINPECYSKMTW
jgi:predicted amidophosphoribosyltransferase